MDDNRALDMIAALSQDTRLQIIRFLVGRREAGAAAGEIGKEVSATSSRASFHLTTLERAGLISSERQSRRIIYRANFANLGGLVSFLLNDCCGSHPDIMACCSVRKCS